MKSERRQFIAEYEIEIGPHGLPEKLDFPVDVLNPKLKKAQIRERLAAVLAEALDEVNWLVQRRSLSFKKLCPRSLVLNCVKPIFRDEEIIVGRPVRMGSIGLCR
jgi:hypothetical protein